MKPINYPPSKKTLKTGVNDLKTLFPSIADELVSEDPSMLLSTSTKKQAWKCHMCDEVWMTAPKSRVSSYDPQPGCPTCKRKLVGTIRNKKILFSEAYPELSGQAKNSNDLDKLTMSSHKAITWVCDKGHEYEMSVNKRVNGRGCPVCSFRQVDDSYNTISAVRPDISSEVLDQKEAHSILANSKKKIEWFHIAEDGTKHIWESSPNDRCYYDYGCGVCAGTYVHKGVNDFKSQILDVKEYVWSRENSFSPDSITAGSNKNVIVYCDKHETPYIMKDKAKYFHSGRRQCLDCVPTGDRFRSKAEREIFDTIIESFPNEKVEGNVKRFKSWGIYDIDIFVNNRIAIDFHGKYWHQEGKFKPVGYHQRKRESMIRHNFPYLEIEEDDWLKDKNQVLDQVLTFVRDNL